MIHSWPPQPLSKQASALRRLRQLPRRDGGRPLAGWRRSSARAAARSVSPTSPTLACGSATKAPAGEVLAEGRNHVRGFPAAAPEVAPRAVAAHQLQERHQQLRTRPRAGRHPEDRVVHAHRIRLAMQAKPRGKLGGEVEVDETYIGGKARNMHKAEARAHGHHSGPFDGGQGRRHGPVGTPRQGRVSQVRSMAQTEQQAPSPDAAHDAHVEKGATVNTDSLPSYIGLDTDYTHKVIDHAEAYVNGHRPHQRPGKLLVSVEARHQGHLRERRTVPSVPLPR